MARHERIKCETVRNKIELEKKKSKRTQEKIDPMEIQKAKYTIKREI